MLVQSLLRRFVVVGADAQYAVNALEVARLQLLDDSRRVKATATDGDGHLAFHHLNHQVLDALFLFSRQCRRLARRGKNTKEVGTVV